MKRPYSISFMKKYKVEFVASDEVNSKWYEETEHVDSWSLAKELEALLNEYEKNDYKVISIQQITTPVSMNQGAGSKTDGLLVVFEKEE